MFSLNRYSFTKQRRYLGPDPEPNPAAPPAPPPPKKEMTQSEIDALVAKRVNEERAKAAKEQQVLLDRLKTLEPEAEKRAELERRIEDIERAGLTQKQLDEMDRKKEKEKLLADRDAAEKKAATIKVTYESEKLARDLMDATSSKEADAFNAKQLAELMRPHSRLVEKDGKMEVRVKYVGLKDGQPIELDATPAEAIKLMKDDPANGNLFKAGVTGGVGGTQPRTLTKAGGKLGLTQEEFTKRYAKGTLPVD